MKDFSSDVYVAGTAALQPDCSRNRNENECIIEFPTNQITPLLSMRRSSIPALPSSKLQFALNKALASLLSLHSVQDLINGDLKGKKFGNFSRIQVIGAGALYAFIALCALYIAV